MTGAPQLSTVDHSREVVGLRYVYPVISRRAGGVSIGINLNTNNACNWACQYCQVPNLTRGAPEPIDLDRLQSEFEGFLASVFRGTFLKDRVPEGQRQVVDVAFSGNGEPTAAPEFTEAVQRVLRALETYPEASALKKVVISNGSHAAESRLEQAFKRLAANHGELWFKLDRGSESARRSANGIELKDDTLLQRLVKVSALIPTWIQTCVYAEAGVPPLDREREAYQRLIQSAIERGAKIEGVHLYTLARPSLQPGADRLSKVSEVVLRQWAEGLSIPVRLSP